MEMPKTLDIISRLNQLKTSETLWNTEEDNQKIVIGKFHDLAQAPNFVFPIGINFTLLIGTDFVPMPQLHPSMR